jgi:hypothetical protein
LDDYEKSTAVDIKVRLANLPKLNLNAVYGSNITKTYKLDDSDMLQKRAEPSGGSSQLATPIKKLKPSPFSHQDLNTPKDSISKAEHPKIDKVRHRIETPKTKEEEQKNNKFLDKLIVHLSKKFDLPAETVINAIKLIPGDQITSEQIGIELNKIKDGLDEKKKAPVAKKDKTKIEQGLIR